MREVNYIGMAAVIVCIAASGAISIYYGLTLSTVAWQAAIYASVAVAAIAWEFVGYHRTDRLRRSKRHVAMVLCGLGTLGATFVTLTYEIGFLSELMESKASINQATLDNRDMLERERARLQEQIDKSGISRGREMIEAEIVRLDALASPGRKADLNQQVAETRALVQSEAARGGCGERCRAHEAALASLAGDLVQIEKAEAEAGRLRAELGAAVANARAQARIEEITAAIAGIAATGATDARSNYLSRVLGTAEETARLILALIIMAFLLVGRAWGGFVFMSDRDRNARRDEHGMAFQAAPAFYPLSSAQIPHDVRGLPFPEVIRNFDDEAEVEAQRAAAELPADDEDGDGPADDIAIQAVIDEAAMNRALNELVEGRGARSAEAPYVKSLAANMIDGDMQKQQFARFVDECLIMDGSDNRESAGAIYDCFVAWWSENRVPGVPPSASSLGMYLTPVVENNGGSKFKSGYKRYYVGVTIRPPWAHKIAQDSNERPNEKVQRLGNAIPRRDYITLPDSGERPSGLH